MIFPKKKSNAVGAQASPGVVLEPALIHFLDEAVEREIGSRHWLCLFGAWAMTFRVLRFRHLQRSSKRARTGDLAPVQVKAMPAAPASSRSAPPSLPVTDAEFDVVLTPWEPRASLPDQGGWKRHLVGWPSTGCPVAAEQRNLFVSLTTYK